MSFSFLIRRRTGQQAARPSRSLALLAVLLLIFAVTRPSTSQETHHSTGLLGEESKLPKIEMVPGEILIRYRTDPTTKAAESRTTAAITTTTVIPLSVEGRRISAQVERIAGAELVEGLRLARVPAEDTLQAIAALNLRSDVMYAEPNYIRRKDAVPNDPRFAELWGLKNAPNPNADIDAELAWDVTTGNRNVVVGVVDEGIDVNHPDLSDNIWRNPGEVPGNLTDDDGNGFVDDYHGYDFFHNDASVYDGGAGDNDTDRHGTHVAGTIGATGNNGQGVVGVNWQTSLMSLKILGRPGERPAPTSVRLTVQAFGYAKMMRDLYVSSGGTRGANIRVLNNSYGGGRGSQAEFDAIKALNLSGILFVAAAGNESSINDELPHYPASYDLPNVISVAATDRQNDFTVFTNSGKYTVHMAAPGSGILSTTPNNTYSAFSGTSMAAPHVAGTAALICAAYPNLSAARLRAALLYSGDKIPALRGAGTLTERRLNALKALQNAAENDTTPPAAPRELSFTALSPGDRQGLLSWSQPGDDGEIGGQTSLFEIRFSEEEITSSEQFERARPIFAGSRDGSSVPVPATKSSVAVGLPYQRLTGFFSVRETDNAGNHSPVVSIRATADRLKADPYLVTQGSTATLSTGGTPLGLTKDDAYRESYPLPFDFPYFGRFYTSVAVSTNGVLHFAPPPKRPDGSASDADSSITRLNYRPMIAGLWDDLRTDQRPGDDVYVVVAPDRNRIIFRWQAVTFDTPLDRTTRGQNPVNFEIELRRDGTIQTRYGDGNANLLPIVGISGGAPDAYVVSSLTFVPSLVSLANASTVTYTPRALLPTPIPPTTTPPPPVSPQAEIKTWTLGGRTSAHVKLILPDASRSVADWKQVSRSGNNFSVDTVLGQAPDSNVQAVTTTAQIYDLGSLAAGTYTFTFSTNGQTLKTHTFTVSAELPVANPLDNTREFVRQQYIDFLAREPDAPGWNHWAREIEVCVGDTKCIDRKRANTSGAFFLSTEFSTLR